MEHRVLFTQGEVGGEFRKLGLCHNMEAFEHLSEGFRFNGVNTVETSESEISQNF